MMNNIYDNAYKYIFSNKTIFYQLITSFVHEDFIKGLNKDDIQLIDRSFVSNELLKRESDLIYKIKSGEHESYIYFLLEFQSTVDKSIPIRMLLYILQFYDLLFRESRKGKLPSVFPVLLYNGESDWTVPDNINELIDNFIPARYIPSFEYYKIIEKDIPDSVLLKIHNLASAIIYLEKHNDKTGLNEALDQVINLIKEEKLIDAAMFTNWFKKIFYNKTDIEMIDKINNITEVKTMLTMVAEQIKEEGIKEGIKEGDYKRALKDAKKMLGLGLALELISDITGLSTEEINKLEKK